MAGRQRHDLLPMGVHECASADEQRPCRTLDESHKSGLRQRLHLPAPDQSPDAWKAWHLSID
jgi:hypothetical protein